MLAVSYVHVWLQFGHDFRQVIVLEQNSRSHIMSSSANDDLTSIYAGSDDICSSGYDCNSEDVQLENSEEKDDIKWF